MGIILKFSLTALTLAAASSSAMANGTPPIQTNSPTTEVKASSGPVEITLTLASTHIPSGYPIRYRARLRNIGSTKISFHDEVFSFPEIMNRRYVHPEGNLFIEVLDSMGKHPLWRLPISRPSPDGYDPAMDPQHAPMAKYWVERKEMAQINPQVRESWLEPGASTATVSYSRHTNQSVEKNSSETTSSDFAEISALSMPPGKYQIRAIWNSYFKPADVKKYHLKPRAWNVRVETPPIRVEVLP